MQHASTSLRALALDPDIHAHGQSFSALDPLHRRDMQDELLDIQERVHKTIILSAMISTNPSSWGIGSFS
jgi:glycine betaine/proline transport system ATP-binding protein